MIRTTPWEVSRDVKLMARDESSWHSLDGVRSMREAFARHNPEGRLTWGFTLNALEDKRRNYQQIRDYAVECHQRFQNHAGMASTMLTGEFVGMIRVSLKLAFSSKAPYSASLRSWPVVNASMVMSSILPG